MRISTRARIFAGLFTALRAWGFTALRAWGFTALRAWGLTALRAWGLTALRAWGLTALCAWGLAALTACHRASSPDTAGTPAPMGSWAQWQDLSPLLELARSHAPRPTIAALEQASKLLREGKPRAADQVLAQAEQGDGRHWVAVARADLAALYFETCIRGIALRLAEGEPSSATERGVDFSKDAKLAPGDISIEATLTKLDEAVQQPVAPLATQARIARARLTAFAQRCAPNEDVMQLATQTAEADLATLAAGGHLTPDLSYLWAGVQMQRFTSSAARPFLIRAQEGGFDHPSVGFMLGVIALEEHDLDRAEKLGRAALERFTTAQDPTYQAESLFLLGEVARQRKDHSLAQTHYRKAIERAGMHVPATLALIEMAAEHEGEERALAVAQQHLPTLLLDGELDEAKAAQATSNIESLVMLTTQPHTVQLVRDALLQGIENEDDAIRRGLRYFFTAALEVRLREYEVAHGHGVLAKEEFAASDVPPPVDVQAFLDRLQSIAQ